MKGETARSRSPSRLPVSVADETLLASSCISAKTVEACGGGRPGVRLGWKGSGRDVGRLKKRDGGRSGTRTPDPFLVSEGAQRTHTTPHNKTRKAEIKPGPRSVIFQATLRSHTAPECGELRAPARHIHRARNRASDQVANGRRLGTPELPRTRGQWR